MDIPDSIKALAERVRADAEGNHHGTGDPMFCLQVLVRDVGYDIAANDSRCWVNHSKMVVVYDDDTPGRKEDLCWDPDDAEWELYGYQERWETVMVALTQKGIDDYMELDGHNVRWGAFRGRTRIYVKSFCRCAEMTSLREWLMQMDLGKLA